MKHLLSRPSPAHLRVSGLILRLPRMGKMWVFLSILCTQVASSWRISKVPVSEMLLAAALLGDTHQLEVGHLVQSHFNQPVLTWICIISRNGIALGILAVVSALQILGSSGAAGSSKVKQKVLCKMGCHQTVQMARVLCCDQVNALQTLLPDKMQ